MSPTFEAFADCQEILEAVVGEMCRWIGIEPKDAHCWKRDAEHDPEWYLRHTWTAEQQQDFTDWLADKLYADKDWRKLMRFPEKNKAKCQAAAAYFVLQFGWRVSEDNDL